ncbi:MAG: hypothetical protein JSV79_08345 [Armatimonadota bacterium]|nr:MAG: hypothetical protein JSV79_08345 [Armatimonadota bacterium]
MPQVKCPRCGTINDTRAAGYPFCVGCQDNLARCGYCRWFDNETVICTQPLVADVFEVSEEATPPCGYHTARESIQVRRWGVHALVWVGLAAAVFALGFGLLELFRAPPTAPPPPALELAVEADRGGAVVKGSYTAEVLIYNASDRVVEDIRLEIGKESLDTLYLSEVRPEPLLRGESGGWRVLAFPRLNPHERRRIALVLVPRKAGPQHLVVRLLSGENAYHGQCDLPIMVAADEAEGEEQSSRGE